MRFSLPEQLRTQNALCALYAQIWHRRRGFFFHSCNHLFASFASSAQGKLLSWQHLSLRIIEAVTGANSAKGF